MARKVVTKTVLICDLCNVEWGSLTNCKTCGAEHCRHCQGLTSYGTFLPVCKECVKLADVREAVDACVVAEVAARKEMFERLEALGKKPAASIK